MRIVLVLKPYAIEVYTREQDIYTLVSIEQTTQIEQESLVDYEKRMIFVCKDMCNEIRSSAYFKEIASRVKGIDIVLSSPWCTYDVMHIEKDFGKKTKITENVLKSMFVKKDEKELYIVESYMSHVLLNGYVVENMTEQLAQTVEFQYVHVYARESFASSLIKTMESIFHTHQIFLTSIYGLVSYISKQHPAKHASEIQIILEEESLDISYIHNGLRVVNMFIPHSYIQAEHDVAMKLSTNSTVIRQVLVSKGQCLQQDSSVRNVNKNAKKLWPDLDDNVKQIINQTVDEHMEKIIKNIRDCVDSIDSEYLKHTTSLYIYGVNQDIVYSYGLELAKKISEDPYISMKILLHTDVDSVTSIF